jgi:hypothetical protein
MLKAKLIGDWKTARNILGAASQLKDAINYATVQEAHDARRKIIKGITSQAPAGQQFQALSAITIALRKARGFRGRKILIVTGGLRNAVTVQNVGPGLAFVGVKRSARSKDGKQLFNVARIQENGGTIVIAVTPRMRKWLMIQLRKSGFGTREKGDQKRDRGGRFKKKRFVSSGDGQMSKGVLVIKIPARPFMQPIIDEIARDPEGLRKRLAMRIAKKTGMALGSP